MNSDYWVSGSGMAAMQKVVEHRACQHHCAGAEVHAPEAGVGDEHPEDERPDAETDVGHHEERGGGEAHAVPFG